MNGMLEKLCKTDRISADKIKECPIGASGYLC